MWRKATFVLLWTMACGVGCAGEVSSDDQIESAGACIPGLVLRCACSGGAFGVSTCGQDRQAGPCECPDGATPIASGGVVDSGSLGGTGGATPGLAGDAPTPTAEVLARDIRIQEIAVYQPVKVSLAQQGQAVIERNAPIIAGKSAVVRVFVEPLPGFVPRELEVVLTLASSEGSAATASAVQRFSGTSADDDLQSTVNFDVPGASITEDLRYSVSLHETGAVPELGRVDPAARFPTSQGELTLLGARDPGPLQVMLVPYLYGGDGSNRSPVVSEQQLQLFQDALQSRYPVSEISLEVHEPVVYRGTVTPQIGWEDFLEAHCLFRNEEGPDPKVLYYGVIAPRDSLRAYGSGIMGISYLPGPAGNYGRCSVGVGFAGGIASTTMAHELGHALGLPHAPCGVDGGPYPYSDASIGVWGLERASGVARMVDPDKAFDMMSYCQPSFISDFNFQKLFERVRYLNLQFERAVVNGPERYIRVLQRSDGSHAVTGQIELDYAPGGTEEMHTVAMLDASGNEIEQTTGYFLPSSEAGSGLWLVPDTGAAALLLADGRKVSLQ